MQKASAHLVETQNVWHAAMRGVVVITGVKFSFIRTFRSRRDEGL